MGDLFVVIILLIGGIGEGLDFFFNPRTKK